MGLPKVCTVALAFACVTVAMISPVQAQREERRQVTVLDRPRPEVDPIGLPVGSFMFFPELAVTERFRDNIFFSDRDEKSDLISVLSPTFKVESNWNNHMLNVFGTMDYGRYKSHTAENYVDWLLGMDGRVDVQRDTALLGGFEFANRHEARGSPENTAGPEPTFYDVYGPDAGIFHRFNRFNVLVSGNARQFDFRDDNDVLTPGAPPGFGRQIDNDDRDRIEVEGSGRVGYEIVPEYEAFVRGTYFKRLYDDALDNDGFNRDSRGYEVVVGTAIDLTGILFGNVFAGWRQQEFDDGRLGGMQGPGFGADVTWNPTGVTTVKAFVARTVEETTRPGSSGIFVSRVGASVDQEVLRNLVASAHASYQNSDFEQISREDDTFRGGASVLYMIHRHLYVSLVYDFVKRKSTTGAAHFEVNTGMVRISTQY